MTHWKTITENLKTISGVTPNDTLENYYRKPQNQINHDLVAAGPFSAVATLTIQVHLKCDNLTQNEQFVKSNLSKRTDGINKANKDSTIVIMNRPEYIGNIYPTRGLFTPNKQWPMHMLFIPALTQP